MRAASATDVTDEVRHVTAATVVLHRRGMRQVPVEVSRALAAALPRGRLVVLEGARPTLFLEDPTAVVDLLLDFVCDGVEPASPLPAATGAGRGRLIRPRTSALTPRETEVLRLLAAGESNAQIARRLGVSAHTVERHIANLYPKIGARGRADATAYAIREGLD
jgi:DNA-binding CsgD family transcriptional regulator